jgi:hypothetical protein
MFRFGNRAPLDEPYHGPPAGVARCHLSASDRQSTSVDPKSERGDISTNSFLFRTRVVDRTLPCDLCLQQAARIHSLLVVLPMYRFP